jgi:hypothetical protein
LILIALGPSSIVLAVFSVYHLLLVLFAIFVSSTSNPDVGILIHVISAPMAGSTGVLRVQSRRLTFRFCFEDCGVRAYFLFPDIL